MITNTNRKKVKQEKRGEDLLKEKKKEKRKYWGRGEWKDGVGESHGSKPLGQIIRILVAHGDQLILRPEEVDDARNAGEEVFFQLDFSLVSTFTDKKVKYKKGDRCEGLRHTSRIQQMHDILARRSHAHEEDLRGVIWPLSPKKTRGRNASVKSLS